MQNSFVNITASAYSPIRPDKGRTGLFNGVTSTPLSSPTSQMKNSLFLRNKLTPLQSPPLYNLSDVSNTTSRSPKPIQNVSGPLLASTRFNVNLGTYTDTKSPGLANRIVQYSNEAKQKQIPTHQVKYGSPGLFPVVHFFKKDIPIITPKDRKVTVKIASPDTSWYNSPEFGITRLGGRSPTVQNGPNLAQISTDTETRSVLDALKEISRKRIHTTPDFETEEDVCKRQKRTDNIINLPDNSKRGREDDSPIADAQNKSSIQPPAKKICVVDMLAASYTSSQLFKEKLQKGLEKKTELESADKILAKQAQLLNVGTQTSESDKPSANKDDVPDRNESSKNPPPMLLRKKRRLKMETKPVQEYRNALIFDEKRLEISRKNRLATLLCALTGETPEYIKYEKSKLTPSKEPQPEVSTPTTTSPQKLVSILSPHNKPKHDKHVTFNLPQENSNENVATISSKMATVTSQTTIVSSTISVSTPTKDSQAPFSGMSHLETPKSALGTPAVTKLDFGSPASSVTSKESTTTSEVSAKMQEFTSSDRRKEGGFAFKPQIENMAATATATPVSLEAPQSIVTSKTSPMTMISPKSGGFKFDLTKSPSETKMPSLTSPSTPKFNFGEKGQGGLNTQTSLPGFSMPQTTTTVIAPTFTVGTSKFTAPTQAVIAAPLTFPSNTTNTIEPVKAFAAPPSNPVTFAGASQTFTMGEKISLAPSAPSTTNTLSNPNTFNFNNSTSMANTVVSTSVPTMFGIQPTRPTEKAISSPFPSSGSVANLTFGSQPNAQAITSFGNSTVPSSTTKAGFGLSGFPTSTTSTTPSFGFGNPITMTSSASIPPFATTTSTPMFGTSTTSSGFGTNETSTPAFGATTSALTFGTNTSSSTPFGGTTNATPTFGVANSVAPGFGTNTTATSVFGNATSATPGFGNATTTTPGFGTNTTNAPIFGSAAPTEKTFGTTTTTTPSLFVANPANQSFNTSTASSHIFDTNVENKPFAFGANQNTIGGNTSFNAPTTKPSFNFSTTTTSAGPAFTNKAIPAFTSSFPASNVFGATTMSQSTTSTVSSNIFKSPTTTNFGNTASQFGVKPENTFGSKSADGVFGGKSENAFASKSENAFGNFNNSFGTSNNNNAPGFGANVKSPNAFGAGGNEGFGTNSNVGGFGTTTNNTGGFGMNAANSNAFAITPVTQAGFGTNQNNSSTFQTAPSSNNNAFGSNTNNNNNNNNNTSFGSGSGNVFSNTNPNQSGFGFNSGDNTSAFAKAPPPSSGVFGGSASGDTAFQFRNNPTSQAFGGGAPTNATPTAQSGLFAFGGNNAPAPPASSGVFTFGSNDSAKPAYNFNAGSNPTPGFGVSGPNFNAGAPPPSFNPAQFGFSIGAGSTGGRSRTQSKPKRRT